MIYACITTPKQLPLYIILFSIAGAICAVIIVTKNKAVQENNERVQQKNDDLHMQYAQHMGYYNYYQNQLTEVTQGWFPQNYLSCDCIDFFINTLENFRADNVKEIVNLYEQEMHNRRMEAMQNKMVQQNDELIRQQKLANVYQLFQIGQHAYTHSLLQRECGQLEAINNNTARTARVMERLEYGDDSIF